MKDSLEGVCYIGNHTEVHYKGELWIPTRFGVGDKHTFLRLIHRKDIGYNDLQLSIRRGRFEDNFLYDISTVDRGYVYKIYPCISSFEHYVVDLHTAFSEVERLAIFAETGVHLPPVCLMIAECGLDQINYCTMRGY